MKYNIILHITTFCNYDCSYCDVIKDKRKLKQENLIKIIDFIKENELSINRFKFFGWEPLLAWKNIKYIIDETQNIFWNKFEIVTNTTLLTDEIGEYFEKYFEIIFFSIDSENIFDYNKVFNFINKYNLKEKVYFNLIISPWKENFAYEQFFKIYSSWYKNFNILPVYFTKEWQKQNLILLSIIIKKILNKSLLDNTIRLYWFQENSWYNSSLMNNSLFIDIDLNMYYSDFVSTYLWKWIKNVLFIWNIKSINIQNIDYQFFKERLVNYENKVNALVKWQKELHKIMDYFSHYLNCTN